MKLNEELLKQIEEMPKVVLHLHLDGSLRPETVREWIYEATGKEPELENVKKLLMVDKDCRNLNEYLTKFDLPVKLLQTKEHIKRAVYELYEDLSKQGVMYGEVRFAPCLHTKAGLSYNEIVETAIRGLEKAKKDFGIDGNLILCTMRGNDEENKQANIETVKVAKKYLNRGVCALDIAGAEALFPTRDFEDIFTYARKQGIPFTIHAGEAAGKLPGDDEEKEGPASMWDAIKFGAKRIGHGVQCIYDKKLINYLREKEIPLEICVGSNLQTQATSDKEPHPIAMLEKNGVIITINSDNDTVSNTNIIEEIKYILEHSELTFDDILQMEMNAARSIFDTPVKKAALVNQINNSIDILKVKEPLTK